jgi:dGTPase
VATQGDFEAIVAAACLAHDIGNPPFGHFGEKAIQEWARRNLSDPAYSSLTPAEQEDLYRFEGNAQSFRILTRLQMSNRLGGMRLTAATLGALIKYPRPSLVSGPTPFRKHGHFQDDAPLFHQVFNATGQPHNETCHYARHPLALLSEAADDICYAIIDLEDGCKSGLISLNDGFEILDAIRPDSTGSTDMPDSDRLSMGRAIVINELVQQCAEIFLNSLDDILNGQFTGSLIAQCPAHNNYSRAKKIAFKQVFNCDRVLEMEAAGYRAIQGLLDILARAALSPAPSGFDSHVLKLTRLRITDGQTAYQKLLACTDNVSGMTDRYCIELFGKLSGHANGTV